jgi:alkylhydroperoxidase/carboxymuconolactone decarboxylase family protein YurZ
VSLAGTEATQSAFLAAITDFGGQNSTPYGRAASGLVQHAISSGELSPKERALVLVALAATPTQLDEDELKLALELARTTSSAIEIASAVQLASVVGLHSCSVGIPVLVEELRRRNSAAIDGPYTAKQAALAQAFETSGPRPRPVDWLFDAVLRIDDQYFERFTSFIDAPWSENVLEPSTSELIYIAVDVACTHLYDDGIRRHIGAALDLGVSPRKILEVIQLASWTAFRSPRALAALLAETNSDSARAEPRDRNWRRRTQ